MPPILKTSFLQRNFLPGFLIIVIISSVVFAPSFFQAPRGSDHYHYLVETSHLHDLSGRLVASYSYPRTRQLAEGDAVLFRPVFYILLSVETWAFGVDSFYWQLAALLLHLLVLWQIMRILGLVVRGIFLTLPILCFSLLYISQEMVTWHHISGYMLFLIFFLEGLFRLLRYYFRPGQNERDLVFMVLFFTLACFTFEISIVYVFVLFFVLLWHFLKDGRQGVFNTVRKNKLSVFCIPVISYALVSFSDYLATMPGRGKEAAHFFGMTAPFSTSLVSVVEKLWNIIYLGIGGTLFPCFARMYPFSKTRFDGFILLPGLAVPKAAQILNIFFIVLLINVSVVKALSLLRKDRVGGEQPPVEDRERAALSSVISKLGLALLFTHILLLTIGRSRTHDYITFSLYHYYFLAAFALLACSGRLHLLSERWKARKAALGLIAVVLLGLFAFLNGYQTCRFNHIRKSIDGAWSRYIRDVGDFVAHHRREKDFFFIIFYSQRRKSIGIYEGDPEAGAKHTGFFVDLLFREYLDPKDPRYYLVFTDKNGLVAFKDRPSAAAYLKHHKKRQAP